jgi:hypothetical protein
MDYEKYFHECWDRISPDTVSGEKYHSNLNLIQEITYELYRTNELDGNLPPTLAAKTLTAFFEGIKLNGLR